MPIRLVASGPAISPESSNQPLAGMRIGVIDYGMGNQQSLINAFEYLGATSVLSSEPNILQGCSLLALPGVGAFPKGMAELHRRGLDRFIAEWVCQSRPLLAFV